MQPIYDFLFFLLSFFQNIYSFFFTPCFYVPIIEEAKSHGSNPNLVGSFSEETENEIKNLVEKLNDFRCYQMCFNERKITLKFADDSNRQTVVTIVSKYGPFKGMVRSGNNKTGEQHFSMDTVIDCDNLKFEYLSTQYYFSEGFFDFHINFQEMYYTIECGSDKGVNVYVSN